MKKIYLTILSILLFALAVAVSGCGGSTSSSNDKLTGTWQRQVTENYAFDKAIEEIVIEKEKNNYFVKSYLWRYVSNGCVNDKGKYDKDANGNLICTFKLTQKPDIPKTPAELKGNTLMVKVGLAQVALTEKEGKIVSTGFNSNQEHTFLKKDDKKFKDMLKEHLKTISSGSDVAKGWIIKEDNSILEKK